MAQSNDCGSVFNGRRTLTKKRLGVKGKTAIRHFPIFQVGGKCSLLAGRFFERILMILTFDIHWDKMANRLVGALVPVPLGPSVCPPS